MCADHFVFYCHTIKIKAPITYSLDTKLIALINLNLYSWRETKFAINTAKWSYTDDVFYPKHKHTAIYFAVTSFLMIVNVPI